MELISCSIPKSTEWLLIAPIGDIQYTGPNGSTAEDQLSRHIEYCLGFHEPQNKKEVRFVGVGDYIDFLSPSNRQRLINAGLYDTARSVISEKAKELNEEVFERFLKPTKDLWLGLVEGHHFSEGEGTTTDETLAGMLNTKFLGTSAFIKIPVADVTLYVHHGMGGGTLPGSGLNKLYHTAAGLQGADVYLMGHNTKLVSGRLSRPFPVWDSTPPRLEHRDIWIVNCGGFSKSNIVGHRQGAIPRGDYAEQGMMTPSPLSAPIITVNLTATYNRIRVSI